MRDFAPAPDNSADEAFNSLANRIGLRSDVHTLWDDHEFVFVPKFDHAQGHCLVAHSLVNDVEVVSLYHDTRVQELDHVPYQYLYLRFVIAILRRVPQFIKESQPVPLSIRSAQYEYELKELDWTSAVTLMREDGRHPSTGRKKSPRKRSRSQNERNCSCDASTPRSSHNSVDDSSSTTDISIDDTSACPSDDDDTAHRTTKRRHLLCPTSGAKGPIFELEESCSGALTFKEVPGNDWTAVLEQYDRGRPRKRMRT